MADEKLPRPTSGQLWPPRPVIYEPIPEDMLWRYLDFTKFVSLLDKSALFLPNADAFEDKWEGSYPRRDSIFISTPECTTDPEKAKFVINIMNKRIDVKKRCYISCWHINKHESAAMWNLYAKSGFGIAIQTSYKSLRSAIGHIDQDDHTRWTVFPKVIYLDYETETFEGAVAEEDITPFFHKRKSFEHENEFRIITLTRKSAGSGTAISVDLKILIEKIYVSPHSPEWLKHLVASVLSKYGYSSIPAFQSNLERNPIY